MGLDSVIDGVVHSNLRLICSYRDITLFSAVFAMLGICVCFVGLNVVFSFFGSCLGGRRGMCRSSNVVKHGGIHSLGLHLFGVFWEFEMGTIDETCIHNAVLCSS